MHRFNIAADPAKKITAGTLARPTVIGMVGFW
jgi:hypothetical protein